MLHRKCLLACLSSVPLTALVAHGIKLFFTESMNAEAGGFQIDRTAVLIQVTIALRQDANITVREAIRCQ